MVLFRFLEYFTQNFKMVRKFDGHTEANKWATKQA